MSEDTIQDFINLTLVDETTVVNDTVRIVASINALVQPGQSDDELRADIRATMARLIPDVKWQFANLARTTDASGVERVSLSASTRVSEKENSDLDGRARAASRPGLTISAIQVDTSIPRSMLDEAERDLRLSLLRKAREEAEKVNDVFDLKSNHPLTYRVHNVTFAQRSGDYSNNRTMSKGGAILAAATSMSYGSGFDDDGALGNAQKLVLTAEVVLSRKFA